MTLFPFIRLILLKLRKQSRFTSAQDSVSTPLGLKAYRDVNTQVKLEDGIKRAKNRCYVPRVEE